MNRMSPEVKTDRKLGPSALRIIVAVLILFGCALVGVVAANRFINPQNWTDQQIAAIRAGNASFNLENTPPAVDPTALEATQEALLNGYAWVNRDAQIARIPIDRAMELLPLAMTGSTPTATPVATAEGSADIARPSNPGGGGPALNLTGDAQTGAELYVANCQKCHGMNGQGGVLNPGSDDGTVPPLNPIDDTMISPDPQVYAYNVDLFIEHGSTPAGPSPQLTMAAWGDEGKLAPQQIADLIAYIMSLNPAPSAEATVEPTAS